MSEFGNMAAASKSFAADVKPGVGDASDDSGKLGKQSFWRFSFPLAGVPPIGYRALRTENFICFQKILRN